ncbi:MAG TPA: hypothetical protein DEF57_04255 [Candidatus Magasanikbacteria bacterium]|nr:hypothetical protein [Candidatus Magasanikbacteria bacterium]
MQIGEKGEEQGKENGDFYASHAFKFSTVAEFDKLEYNVNMAIRKIIIKVSRSKHRIPPELREAAFKRKAGQIKKYIKRESRQKLLKELNSAI